MGRITYTDADVNQILNEPLDFYFREKGSTGSYTHIVFKDGGAFNYTPTLNTYGFDDVGDVFDAIAEETGTVEFGYGQPFNIEDYNKLAGGLFTRTVVTSGAKVLEDQVIAAGWSNKTPVVLNLVGDSAESYAGVYFTADGEPAITSVTASVSGVLAENDDYTIVSDPQSRSGYSIVLNTAGTATVATTETITIVYNDPTCVSKETLSGGGKKNMDAIEGYMEAYLRDGVTRARAYFHKGFFNGNMNIPSPTENDPAPVVSNIVINLKKDTERAIGSQVWTIEKEVV